MFYPIPGYSRNPGEVRFVERGVRRRRTALVTFSKSFSASHSIVAAHVHHIWFWFCCVGLKPLNSQPFPQTTQDIIIIIIINILLITLTSNFQPGMV